jgi:recombination protein RecA
MARIMSQGLNRLKGRLLPLRGILIIVNQVRDKVGVIFGRTEDTPGGRAVKFYADLRLRLSGKKEWKPKTIPAKGQFGKMFVDKSKLAPPHQEQKFRLIFEAKDPQLKLGLDSNYKPRSQDEDE